jgi:hypothetical protein
MDQPFLQKDLGEHWRTIYPDTIDLYDELFGEALELMELAPAKAERILRKIITACGNGHWTHYCIWDYCLMTGIKRSKAMP